jgi:hypothetical protein
MSSPHNCPSPFLDPRFYNKPEEPVEEYLKKKNEKNLNIKNIQSPSKKDEKHIKDQKEEEDQAPNKEER